MSRLKRIAISTALTLAVLGGTTMLWYQSHYMAPAVLPTPPPLPSPNGFDTLEKAIKLQRSFVPGKDLSVWEIQPLAVRLKLVVENKPCLEKTREALTQEYRRPLESNPFYWCHQKLLDFAARTYADSGKLPEAMRCALDSMEVGVVVPRGGGFRARAKGNAYETQGRQVAWQLINRVDAKTARAAVARLERIEGRRWPLSESLREDLQFGNFKRELAVFQAGPVYAWEKLSIDSATVTTGKADPGRDFRTLWQRAQAVYHGPQWVAYSVDVCVARAQARFDSPWHPDRPDGIEETSYSITGYRNKEMEEYFNRAQCALLKAYLARWAYEKEHGAPPRSLEELVSAGYLKAVPVDPFSPTRAPLRYSPDGTLWSVGPDATDDGGTPLTQRTSEIGDRFFPGDLLPGTRLEAHWFYRRWW